MFDDTIYSLNNPYHRMEPMNSFVRLLHASPDAPPVDIYANDKLVAKNFSYRDFTPYLNIPSGNTSIRVFPAGRKINPVINTSIFVPAKSIFTVAAAGKLDQISILAIPEPVKQVPEGKSLIRFAHLSSNTPSVDITLPNGTKLFSDVEFKEYTEYIPVDAGTYTLEARPAGTSQVALTVPNIALKPNNFYTVYAVGLLGNKPPLQVLIPLDGNSYLKF